MNHFLDLADLTSEQLHNLLDLAAHLKSERKTQGANTPILANRALAMIFEKPSLRTRVSFEMGMVHLGGHAIFLPPSEIKMGGRETIADVSRVLSGYVDGVMARLFRHDHLLALATHGTIPVINGLTDYNHPAQAVTDLFTIWEHVGRLENVKVVYVGDGNNVARSLLLGAAMTGMHMTVASPEGYTLSPNDYEEAMARRVSASQEIALVTDPVAAMADADIVYTDVWTSMGQEEETAERLRVFPPYQINAQLVAHAKPDCRIMHCLPAHRGEEITDEAADSAQSILFEQAENRLHAQKAILATLLR